MLFHTPYSYTPFPPKGKQRGKRTAEPTGIKGPATQSGWAPCHVSFDVFADHAYSTKQCEFTFQRRHPLMWSHHGWQIAACIKGTIWFKSSFRNSNRFSELLPDMTNLKILFYFCLSCVRRYLLIQHSRLYFLRWPNNIKHCQTAISWLYPIFSHFFGINH